MVHCSWEELVRQAYWQCDETGPLKAFACDEAACRHAGVTTILTLHVSLYCPLQGFATRHSVTDDDIAAALSALVNARRGTPPDGGAGGPRHSPLTVTPASTAGSGHSEAAFPPGGPAAAEQQGGALPVPREVQERARGAHAVGNLLRSYAAARRAAATQLAPSPAAAARREGLLANYESVLRTVLCIQ
jgi:hypothetical protein